MQNVLIASGETTKKRLQKEESELKNIFKADSIKYCENTEELSEYIDSANTLVFYSDFPESYDTVTSMVSKSKEVDNVIGVEYATDKKLWVYDGVTVANCISPNEELNAIKRVLTVPKYVNFIGQWLAVMFLLFFISGAVFYSNKLYLAYKDNVQQTETEQTQEL